MPVAVSSCCDAVSVYRATTIVPKQSLLRTECPFKLHRAVPGLLSYVHNCSVPSLSHVYVLLPLSHDHAAQLCVLVRN